MSTSMTLTSTPTNSPKVSTSKPHRVFYPLSATAALVPDHRVWLLSLPRLRDHRTVESLAEPAWHAAGIEQVNPVSHRRLNPSEHAVGGMQRDDTAPHTDGQFCRRSGWWQPTTACRLHDDRIVGGCGTPYRRSAHAGSGNREMHTLRGPVFVSKSTALGSSRSRRRQPHSYACRPTNPACNRSRCLSRRLSLLSYYWV